MPSRPSSSQSGGSSSHSSSKAVADRYEPETSLRAALFGEILLCRDRLTLERVVVKTVDLQLASRHTSRAQELVQEDVQLEVEGLSRVRALGGHPNVIRLHKCFVARGALHLVLDYCEGGDLLDACVQRRRPRVDRNEGLSSRSRTRRVNSSRVDSSSGRRSCSDDSCGRPRGEDVVGVGGGGARATAAVGSGGPRPEDDVHDDGNGPFLSGVDGSTRLQEAVAHAFLVDVLSGLRFLHAHGIAHRDVSLENILLRNGSAVIADFGLCVPELSDLSSSPLSSLGRRRPADALCCDAAVGKDYYMAPEIVAREAYDPRRADIWATGIAFFILLTSSPPFERADPSDAGFRYVAKRGVKAVFAAWGLERDVSEGMQNLLERMLCVDPDERITMAEIWQHPVLKRPRSRAESIGGCT
ncbi:unnamed protein product [Hyaloperonospora brassicae]|uniref:Protein kinase domain-containing protein n=1 Tax=Hyaloperonospora brassicae TaxID=162125 RepID=A0AAV0TN77_HYABA|nr:unnamed protein product [Hyaloperonospora brassicae]